MKRSNSTTDWGAYMQYPEWLENGLQDEDSHFPLPNGTQADPRQAWVLPSNEQEK